MDDQHDTLEKRKSNLKKILFGWIKDNYDKAFLFVLIGAFVLRLIIFLKTMNQPLWYDSAVYLATAKKWALGLNVNDVWYYRRGYFWPLFCAVFFKLGLGETAIRLSEVFFSTGIVFVSYFLVKELFDKRLALFTAIGLSCSWIILFFTGRPMTSIPATFFLLLALLFFWKGPISQEGKKFFYLFVFFYTLAILTRMQYLMFAPIFLLALFFRHKFKFLKNKHLWLSLIIFGLLMIPLLMLYASAYGNPFTDILNYYLGVGGVSETGQVGGVGAFSTIFSYFLDPGAGISYMLTKYILFFFIAGSIIFFADLFLGFDKIFSDKKLQKKLLVFLWIVVPFLVLGYIAPNIEQRYIMPALPFLFMVSAVPVLALIDFFSKKKQFSKKTLTILAVFLFILLMIPNLLWANQLTELKKTSYLELKEAGQWIKENSNPEDIVVSSSEPQIIYYSGRLTYCFGDVTPPNYPTKEDLEELVKTRDPKFFILSIYDYHPDWVYTYAQENSDKLKPVQGYSQNQQPTLIIYEFVENSSS